MRVRLEASDPRVGDLILYQSQRRIISVCANNSLSRRNALNVEVSGICNKLTLIGTAWNEIARRCYSLLVIQDINALLFGFIKSTKRRPPLHPKTYKTAWKFTSNTMKYVWHAQAIVQEQTDTSDPFLGPSDKHTVSSPKCDSHKSFCSRLIWNKHIPCLSLLNSNLWKYAER